MNQRGYTNNIWNKTRVSLFGQSTLDAISICFVGSLFWPVFCRTIGESMRYKNKPPHTTNYKGYSGENNQLLQ